MKKIFIIDKNIFTYDEILDFSHIVLATNEEYEIFYFPNSLSRNFALFLVQNCNCTVLCDLKHILPKNRQCNIRLHNYLIQCQGNNLVLLPFVPENPVEELRANVNFSQVKGDFNPYVYLYLGSKYIPYVTYVVMGLTLYFYLKNSLLLSVDINKKYFWLDYIKTL